MLVNDIQEIILIKDEANVLHKVQVQMSNNSQVMIDLDEMELDEYCHTIDKFVTGPYQVARYLGKLLQLSYFDVSE